MLIRVNRFLCVTIYITPSLIKSQNQVTNTYNTANPHELFDRSTMELVVQRISNYFRIVVLGGEEVGKTTWIEAALREIGGTPVPANPHELWITEKMGPLWSSTIVFAEEPWIWMLQGERFVFLFDLNAVGLSPTTLSFSPCPFNTLIRIN